MDIAGRAKIRRQKTIWNPYATIASAAIWNASMSGIGYLAWAPCQIRDWVFLNDARRRAARKFRVIRRTVAQAIRARPCCLNAKLSQSDTS
ncbi:hypothetical protein [Candidatus Nitrotoga sp. AM1P]|uniref:hypothetical protein n=1 Tax=Candidatus Nitrotoga sp. AM1P TaxID=2559597 RepID=UPI001F548FF6|nr:hypothetical protein [Candidatus Nitrotoga sp. AM1P]